MDAITGVQASLARKAKEVPTHRFGDVWPLICQEQWIWSALSHVLSNEGGKTAGVDGTTREAFKDEKDKLQFVKELRAELKARTFPLLSKQKKRTAACPALKLSIQSARI